MHKIMPPSRINIPLRQLSTFAITGIIATLVHFITLNLLVILSDTPPYLANGAAFLSAVGVSYAGQHFWVFHQKSHHPAKMAKFFLSALFGLIGNMAIMYAIVNLAGYDYLFGFFLSVMLIPAITFIINKYWVFGAA